MGCKEDFRCGVWRILDGQRHKDGHIASRGNDSKGGA